MNDFTSIPDPGQWTVEQHARLVADVDTVLDVEAGLRDVLLAAHRAALTEQSRQALDVEAGLAAILPIRDLDHNPDAPPSSTSLDSYAPTRKTTSESEVARFLMSLDPCARLALRHEPAVVALAALFAIGTSHDLADDLADDLDHAYSRDLIAELEHELDLAYVFIRSLVHTDTRFKVEIGLARDLVRECALALAGAPNLARPRAQDLALDRARAIARDLALTLARAFDRALVLVRSCARARDPFLPRGHELVQALVRDFDFARDLARARARALDRARSDFDGADLTDADLTHVSLLGVRWSSTTMWPRAWAARIYHASVEIEPGIYEIRSGNTYIQTYA